MAEGRLHALAANALAAVAAASEDHDDAGDFVSGVTNAFRRRPNSTRHSRNRTVNGTGQAQRRRGRCVAQSWKVNLFLLAKNNDDFVPSVTEQNRLTRNGLGIPSSEQPLPTERTRKKTVIPGHLNLNELEDFIIRLYPSVPMLARVGMTFARATKLRQLVPVSATCVEEMRATVKKSQLFIVPRRDLLSIRVQETEDTGSLQLYVSPMSPTDLSLGDDSSQQATSQTVSRALAVAQVSTSPTSNAVNTSQNAVVTDAAPVTTSLALSSVSVTASNAMSNAVVTCASVTTVTMDAAPVTTSLALPSMSVTASNAMLNAVVTCASVTTPSIMSTPTSSFLTVSATSTNNSPATVNQRTTSVSSSRTYVAASVERRVCAKGHTLFGHECLICFQDQEYADSLAADRARNNPSATAVETPTEQPPAVTSDDAASADVVLTAAEIREARLRALGISTTGTPPTRLRVDLGTPTISVLVDRKTSSSSSVLEHMENAFSNILEPNFNEPVDDDSDDVVVVENDSPMNTSMDDNNMITLEKLVNDQAFLNWLTEEDRDTLSIEVRRSRVFYDAMRTMRFLRPEDIAKPLRVTFKFEPGVDDGGLRREFASLFFRGMLQSSMLIGSQNSKSLAHDGSLLAAKSFLHLGQFVSMTVLQGGFGAPCFCSPVVDYILTGHAQSANIDDVPHEHVKESLRKISKCRITSELVEMLDDVLPERFDWGFRKPTYSVTINDTDSIITTIALHHSVWSCLAELDQFCKGLELFGVLAMMRKQPTICRPLLQHGDQEVSVEHLEQLFHVNYTTDRSNRQDLEQAIMMNWKLFLLSIRNGACKVEVTGSTVNEVVVQLKDVLRFATGAEAVPAGGFAERPCIDFDHSSSAIGRLPTANTCSCRLLFPVWDGLSGENEKVAIDLFTRAIVEGQTFGTV